MARRSLCFLSATGVPALPAYPESSLRLPPSAEAPPLFRINIDEYENAPRFEGKENRAIEMARCIEMCDGSGIARDRWCATILRIE